MAEQNTIHIKYVRSGIGFDYHTKVMIRSLGLTRLNQVVERQDTPQIRGLVARIPHFVEIVDPQPPPAWHSVPEYTILPPEPKAEKQEVDLPAVAEVEAATETAQASEPATEAHAAAEPAAHDEAKKLGEEEEKDHERTATEDEPRGQAHKAPKHHAEPVEHAAKEKAKSAKADASKHEERDRKRSKSEKKGKK